MADEREKDVMRLIDKTHWWSVPKIISYVNGHLRDQGKLPIAEEYLTTLIKQRQTRFFRRTHHVAEKHYYHGIYSNHWHEYQMDLLEQSRKRDKDRFKAFFFVLINTNTHYGHAYPMDDKSSSEIIRCLEKAWDDTGHHIRSIVCDDEAGFSAAETEQWYKAHKVSCKVIPDSNHTALAIVDRFIRTLRDMNTPTIKTERTSDDPKYRDFTEKRMNKLLKIYNETLHKGTGEKPVDMKDDREKETKYIIKRLYGQERRHKIKDYELEEGNFVRYIIPRDKMKKARYKVTPEAYQIKGRDGHSYIIMAKDGSTLTLSRWRLFPLGKKLPPGMKLGATLKKGRGGIPKSIKEVNKTKKKYLVEWEAPDGVEVPDTWEPIGVIKALRQDGLHATEKAFWGHRTVPKWV
jgi:hypothetical protein